jgi:hypothetical protein
VAMEDTGHHVQHQFCRRVPTFCKLIFKRFVKGKGRRMIFDWGKIIYFEQLMTFKFVQQSHIKSNIFG